MSASLQERAGPPRAAATAAAALRGGLRVAALLGVAVAAAWGACALAVQLGMAPALLWVAGGCAVLLALLRRRHARTALALAAVALAALLVWWQSIAPSNARDWADDVVHTATGQVVGSVVTLEHVRHFDWHADGSYTPRWEPRSYDLDRLASLDLVLSHWARPSIAHVLLSFGFDDGRFLAISLEIRRERSEPFTRLGGFFKQYEAAIVAADEADIVRVRTNLRHEDTYLWRLALPAAPRRALLLAYVDEANRLARAPRWYHTLTANCTTIVLPIVRQFTAGRLPVDHRLVLSGYLPRLLHQLGALEVAAQPGDGEQLFEALREAARITARAQRSGDGGSNDFSRAIREGLRAPVEKQP